MARYQITAPDGNSYEITAPDSASMDEVMNYAKQNYKGSAKIEPKTFGGFAKNALTDVSQNVKGALPWIVPSYAIAKSAKEVMTNPAGVLESFKQIPKQIGQEIRHPIKSFYQKPVTTALDASMLLGTGVDLARGGMKLGGAIAEKTLPGTLKATAGIPETMTKTALTTDALRTPPVSDAELTKVVGQPVIDAIQTSKKKVGDLLGKVRSKYADMGNPIDEYINNPQQPRRPLEAIKADYEAAKRGDLFKTQDVAGGQLTMSNKAKLKVLTQLKQEIQAETNFNKAPITNAPIDTVKDAALKKMGQEMSDLRSSLPNGQKMEVMDKAWKNINDIYDTVQKDLSDPGKAKDTIMRIVRGDNTWLTSGRFKNKVNAIRRAEVISGQRILDPAIQELTRQMFSEWAGKGLTSHVLTATGATGTALSVLMHNPSAALKILSTMAATSPKAMGTLIKVAKSVSRGINASIPATRTAGAVGLASQFGRNQDSNQ